MTEYCIEHLSGGGHWQPLRQSSEATGFELRPWPVFPTRAEAEQHIAELRDSSSGWRGLRVGEVRA